MKKTYPGQSNTLNAYCIRATIVSIVILTSAIFLSANAGQVLLNTNTSIKNKSLQQLLFSAKILYNKAKGNQYSNVITLEPELFLKGTINKRPGFSKPGLI